ncbi:hypothetical protein B1B_08767, partial [mine drainage metagenome]
TLQKTIIRNAQQCERCGKRLRECYIYQRTIRTLSGSVNLNVHARKCPDHGETNRNVLNTLVNGSLFDPAVIIAVGLLRFMLDYQREEIQILLESRGYPGPTGEIFNLSRKFLLRFYCIHRRHMK